MQKFNFKIKCSIQNYDEYQNINNVESIIHCIKKIANNDFIYIYDVDTKTRFTIEIYNNNYSLGMMNYYRDFKKDELIKFLNQDFSIFKNISSNPNELGFKWEDDGGT